MKTNRREAAAQQGFDAGYNACLVELHPEYPAAIRIAYEGGLLNPYPWWRPFLRRAWQRSFDAVRREYEEKTKAASDADSSTRS